MGVEWGRTLLRFRVKLRWRRHFRRGRGITLSERRDLRSKGLGAEERRPFTWTERKDKDPDRESSDIRPTVPATEEAPVPGEESRVVVYE